MKIFFFGGAFDPPHLGHRMIVENCLNFCDKFIIFPNLKSPGNDKIISTDYFHRLEMLKILFRKYNIEIDEFELKSNPDNYTYNTIKYLINKYKDSSLTMLIGYDQLLNLKNWYKYKDIIKNVNILCFNRGHDKKSTLENLKNVEVINTFNYDISSSYIRDNYLSILKKGKNKFLSEKIINYIKLNNLYGS